MAGRGGIYDGPGGEKLYGDGREVEPMAATKNQYEEAAREQKAQAIAEAIWRHNPTWTPDQIEQVAKLPHWAKFWSDAAELAGTKLPSATTCELVLGKLAGLRAAADRQIRERAALMERIAEEILVRFGDRNSDDPLPINLETARGLATAALDVIRKAGA